MLCERIVGTVTDDAPDVDWVDLDWRLTRRRALRLVSAGGRRVNLLLPRGSVVHHGDVLGVVDGQTLALRIHPIPVLIIAPPTVAAAIRIAGELGNLHVPIETSGDELIVPDDGPVRELLDEHAASYRADMRRFNPQIVDRSRIGGVE